MNLRREARWLRPIALIIVVALLCGGYILNRQRLESPLADRYSLELEFSAVHAVVPGQGAPVTVAGVAVGQIVGRELDDGRGVLHVDIDPAKLAAVHTGARAALIPNTALKDMQVRLDPGDPDAPQLREGDRVPLAATTSPIDSDELLRALDDDTRTWVQSLITELGVGTNDRGRSLRATLRRLGPTAGQMRRITSLLADRRRQLRRLVSDLRTIAAATTAGDGDLQRVVDAGNATLSALARNDEPLRATLDALPGTLQAAGSTLDRTPRFAGAATRALRDLRPAIRDAEKTLRATPGSLQGVVPLPIAETKRFIDAVAPLGPSVRSAAADLGAATPSLRTAFDVLRRTTNRLASQPPDGGKSSLFWLAWFAHNVNSTLSTQDANGAVARGMLLLSCASIDATGDLGATLDDLLGTGATCEGGARK